MDIFDTIKAFFQKEVLFSDNLSYFCPPQKMHGDQKG